MATGNVIVTVIDVGQGQCTFVEIYDDDGMNPVLLHTLLLDCGTDHRSDETNKNLKYIADKVGGMAVPAFDCIIFSHSDSDHISLMRYLLDQFPLAKKPAIKQVWFGGYYDQFEKDGFNILKYFIDESYCTRDDIKTTAADYSGYDEVAKQFRNYFWKSDDDAVFLYAAVSNIMSSKPDFDADEDVPMLKTPIAKNRVSIIAYLHYPTAAETSNASYMICGDAINATMAAVNKRIVSPTIVFNNTIMTTLPHHGSRTTGLGVPSGKKASLKSSLTVSSFATLLKSKTISVSAYELHSHPSLQLMGTFAPIGTPLIKDPRLLETNAHRVTANIDYKLEMNTGKKTIVAKKSVPVKWTIPQGNDYSFETSSNTFTTRYSRGVFFFSYQLGPFFLSMPTQSKGVITPTPAFNGFASWKYTTAAAGTYTVAGYTDMSSAGTVFTAPATVAVLNEPELIAEKKSAVSVRLKLPAANILASVQPVFNNRLKSFR